MIIPIRCFTCGKVMADIADYYEKEKNKIDETDSVASVAGVDTGIYKNFEKIHTGHILDNLGLKRYCCRRNLISNIDMMNII
jgi:DNA-directed RNA polymerase subunit N (RpoN/RPB10)